MLGSWKTEVTVGALPQAVATAFGKLNEQLLGAEYTPIAYLGSQVVNGTNHAVLAEQLVITGKDTKNIVVIIFNQKPNQVGDATLVSIERVLESGGELGGVSVNVETDIPEEAKAAFNKAFAGFVGSKVEPFVLLGTQVTKGINYIFAAEITPVTQNPVSTVDLVTVNALTNEVAFVDILTSKHDVLNLGYAFTWLKNQNTSEAKTLAE